MGVAQERGPQPLYYYNMGTADGNGYQTTVHVFNPSTVETVNIQLFAVQDNGEPDLAMLNGTDVITASLEPLSSLEVETANLSIGAHAGYLTIQSNGPVAAWNREQSFNGDHELLRNTSAFIEGSAIASSSFFPEASVMGAQRAIPGIPIEDNPIATYFGAHNTESFTTTILLSGRDALLGTALQTQTVEVPPGGGFVKAISEIFDPLPTGRAIITADVVDGNALSYLSFEALDAKAKYRGNPLGKGTGSLPFQHLGNMDAAGFYTTAIEQAPMWVEGDAEVLLTSEETPITQPIFSSNQGAAAFTPTDSFMADPYENGWGDVGFQLESGQPNSIGMVVGSSARSVIKPFTAMGSRGALSVDGDADWSGIFSESRLLAKNDTPHSVALSAASMNLSGQILGIKHKVLTPGVSEILPTDFVTLHPDTVVVVFEVPFSMDQLALDFLVAGYDPDVDQQILDRTPILAIGGPITFGQFFNLLQAWNSGSTTCMGQNLNILSIIEFMNNGFNCSE